MLLAKCARIISPQLCVDQAIFRIQVRQRSQCLNRILVLVPFVFTIRPVERYMWLVLIRT